jgi:hypothetical protein
VPPDFGGASEKCKGEHIGGGNSMTFFLINLFLFYFTKNGLLVGDKILTYHMKDKCNYYNIKSLNSILQKNTLLFL